MATSVDPFLIQIPAALRKDPETFAYFTYVNKFLHDLRARVVGATETDVSTLEATVNQLADLDNTGLAEYCIAQIEILKKRIEALEKDGYA